MGTNKCAHFLYIDLALSMCYSFIDKKVVLNMKIQVISGNLSAIWADALIAVINSDRNWFGAIDEVIKSVAGRLFHDQVTKETLIDGQAHFTRGNMNNSGSFKNVIFVIDDLGKRLHEIILAGLKEAEKQGLDTVTIPTIRMGIAIGLVEKSEDEVLEEMARAIRLFESSRPSSVKTITFVVYQNPKIEAKLKRLLS